MNVQELFQTFLASSQGREAMAALQAQGISAADAESHLGHATEAAHDHVHDHAHSGGLLGEHPGRSFFAAFAAGLIKGDGVMGALADGMEGVVVGRVAEYLAEKGGVDPNAASTIAAAATPYIMSFLKAHLSS
jgi:hypothetical protein